MEWILYLLSILVLQQQQPNPLNPDYHIRLFVKYIQSIPEKDRQYQRALSFYNIPDRELEYRIQTLYFWLPSMSFLPENDPPIPVPGSDRRLWVIDLRNYGWCSRAFTEVAIREFYFIEPAINNKDTEYLRKITYTSIGDFSNNDTVKLDNNNTVNLVRLQEKEFHSLVVMRADFFFRETMETDRSQAYYDLLFSKQRFGSYHSPIKGSGNHAIASDDMDYTIEKRTWPGGPDRKGTYFPAGWQYEVRVPKRSQNQNQNQNRNFPETEDDWDSVFGIDIFEKFLKESKINAQHGAIVEEGYSIVAQHNRLILRRQTPFGASYKTFDVNESTGKRDFTEQLFYDFEFDAAELIVNLPNGSQAYLLVNNKRKRLETADNRFAKDTSDRRMDARVRTPGSCVVCHREGINPPINHFKNLLDKGVDLKVRDKQKMLEIRSFFLNWDRLLKFDQSVYTDFVYKTTGLTGPKNASQVLDWRDAYDAEMTPDQIAVEIGVPLFVLKDFAFKSPKGRLQSVVRDIKTPRRTFEKDIYREFVLLLDASKR